MATEYWKEGDLPYVLSTSPPSSFSSHLLMGKLPLALIGKLPLALSSFQNPIPIFAGWQDKLHCAGWQDSTCTADWLDAKLYSYAGWLITNSLAGWPVWYVFSNSLAGWPAWYVFSNSLAGWPAWYVWYVFSNSLAGWPAWYVFSNSLVGWPAWNFNIDGYVCMLDEFVMNNFHAVSNSFMYERRVMSTTTFGGYKILYKSGYSYYRIKDANLYELMARSSSSKIKTRICWPLMAEQSSEHGDTTVAISSFQRSHALLTALFVTAYKAHNKVTKMVVARPCRCSTGVLLFYGLKWFRYWYSNICPFNIVSRPSSILVVNKACSTNYFTMSMRHYLNIKMVDGYFLPIFNPYSPILIDTKVDFNLKPHNFLYFFISKLKMSATLCRQDSRRFATYKSYSLCLFSDHAVHPLVLDLYKHFVLNLIFRETMDTQALGYSFQLSFVVTFWSINRVCINSLVCFLYKLAEYFLITSHGASNSTMFSKKKMIRASKFLNWLFCLHPQNLAGRRGNARLAGWPDHVLLCFTGWQHDFNSLAGWHDCNSLAGWPARRASLFRNCIHEVFFVLAIQKEEHQAYAMMTSTSQRPNYNALTRICQKRTMSLQKSTQCLISREEKQKAMLNEMIAKITDVCWDKCITGTPGSKFSSGESSCLSYCAQRYMDMSIMIMKRFQGGDH